MKRVLSSCLLLALALPVVGCSDERPIALPPSTLTDRGTVVRTDGGPGDDDASEGEDAMGNRDAAPLGPDLGMFDSTPGPGRDAELPRDAEPSRDAEPGRDAERDAGLPVDVGGNDLDLTLRFAAPPPLAIAAGANQILQIDVENVGARNTPPTELLVDLRPAGAPVSMAQRLTVVAARSLMAGATENLTFTVVLPANLASGNYVLRALLDPDNLLAESDEGNNTIEATPAVVGVEVTPASIAFPSTAVGCVAPAAPVSVRNVGAIAAIIDGATIVGSAEMSVGGLTLPRTIQPGTTAQFTVGYAPTDVGSDAASLQLRLNQGAITTLMLPVTGQGRASTQHTERFALANTTARLDLLMLIDNSGSMSEEQTQLASQVPAFLQWAQANSVDFRVAVVTTDMDEASQSGRFQGNPLILTPTTPNLMAAFAANIQRGTSGSGNEQGLAAIVAALTAPLSTTVNQNFLRADAVLGVLILTDENDFSPGAAADYIAQLAAVRPMGRIRVNAIATPMGGCPSGVDESVRYLQMAQQFNGTVESICASSWQAPLTTWGMIGGVQSRFVLTRPARPGSITVRQGAVTIPAAPGTWTYDAATNAVVFASGVLMPGATLEIVYTEACAP